MKTQMPLGKCLFCRCLPPFGVSNSLDDFPEKCHFGSFSWHVSKCDFCGLSRHRFVSGYFGAAGAGAAGAAGGAGGAANHP